MILKKIHVEKIDLNEKLFKSDEFSLFVIFEMAITYKTNFSIAFATPSSLFDSVT